MSSLLNNTERSLQTWLSMLACISFLGSLAHIPQQHPLWVYAWRSMPPEWIVGQVRYQTSWMKNLDLGNRDVLVVVCRHGFEQRELLMNREVAHKMI